MNPLRLLALALCLFLALPLLAQTITTRTLDVGSSTDGETGQYTSQAIVNGNPAIAYYNMSETNLMFARNSTADGSGAWTVTTVDLAGAVGQYASLTVVNGNPAISYYDQTNGDLKYVRAQDANGTSWGTAVTVASAGNVGQFTSLVVVNSNPAISYYDVTNGDLKYVRALDVNGTSWGTPATPDSTNTTGLFTSLVVVNGNPAISYQDQTNQDLKYVRALDANGTNWGTPVTVDSTDRVGQYTSLAVINGNPAISYNDSGNGSVVFGALRYVRALDTNGSSWGTPVNMGGPVQGFSYTSLAVVNGNPAISCYDVGNTDLRYVRALDANGTSWGTLLTVNVAGAVGQFTSLVVVAGNPAISYFDGLLFDLKYVRALDANGTNWGTATTPDAGVQSGNTGVSTSQAIIAGTPAISYFDVTNAGSDPTSIANLRYVRALDASETSWSAPVTLDSSASGGGNTSLVLVNGNPAIGYGCLTTNEDFETYTEIRYVRALDAGGTSWGTPVNLHSSIGVLGSYPSMAVVNGNPAISYYDLNSFHLALNYVRALDANGTSWGAPITVDNTSNTGLYTSLVVVNGNPAISYYDQDNGDLKYVRALNASGTSWGTPVSVDSTGDVGQFTSLAVVNGSPAISYYDVTNGNLKYARALDASGANWGTPVTLDSVGDIGRDTALAVVAGRPAISYRDFTNRDLKYVRALDANGTNWAAPLTLDSIGDVGQFTSLVATGSNAAISYWDITNGDLKWAMYVTPLTALEAWRQTWFGDAGGIANGADAADPNANGIKNLLEYALSGDPAGHTTSRGILPQVATSAGNKLQISFTRFLDRTDLTLTVYAADSLAGPWTALAQSTAGGAFAVLTPPATAQETGAGNPRSVTVTDLYLKADPAHPTRFLKLEATH